MVSWSSKVGNFSFLHFKQAELFRSFMQHKALCLCVRTDSTVFKLWPKTKKQVCTEEISISCVEAYGANSAQIKLFPSFCRMISKKYDGIVGAIDLKALNLLDFCAGRSRLRILIICVDNNSANRKAIRRVVNLFRPFQNLLIGAAICFDHVLANSAKWGTSVFLLSMRSVQRIT